jgi:lactoylglutathione lyase
MKKARILHTMIRVTNMEQSVEFYTAIMGMKVLRTFERPEDGYSLVFLGYGEESESCVLELTYNHGVSEYQMGNAYGHIAIGVTDCYRACESVRFHGGKVVREAGPLRGSKEVIAFVTDPDGYKIELVERPAEWL